ncbi:MAG: acyltransferase family protein [Actinobacteria bacterium]|nr:acyltransferase family protein [Actinomycetota bacterium]
MADDGNGPIRSLLEWRRGDGEGGYSEHLMRLQEPVWDALCRYYFRLEVDGWERLPDPPCLLVGVHSGAALTMDAWTLIYAWWRHFGPDRFLHGTAHDVLMAAPGLGDYFRRMGVLPASGDAVSAALAAGDDVIVWPGGEKDSMRHWRKRDTAVLGGRTGFVRMAVEQQVPIVPVATVGGHDTVFVVNEGGWIARLGGLGDRFRAAKVPIVVGPPFGIAIETVPMHLPLPAKIRTEFLDPIDLDAGPEDASDEDLHRQVYEHVEAAIQAGMDRLAAKRRFPVFL